MNVTWEVIGGIVTLLGVANYLMLLSIKNTISENNDKLRDWINGSFMRSKEVDARLGAVEHRVALIENKD